MMTTETITAAVSMVLTILAAIYAWYQNKQKNAVVEFYSEPSAPIPSALPVTLPSRSWTMSESTRRWITFGESDEDKIAILKEVDANEALGNRTYSIHYSKGFYLIEYGLIKASGREK